MQSPQALHQIEIVHVAARSAENVVMVHVGDGGAIGASEKLDCRVSARSAEKVLKAHVGMQAP